MTLKDRLNTVMQAMNWEYTDLVRVSQQTHSVVSQWLGRGSKEIKTIGKLEAAIYIERASGFSALWIAKGMGPAKVDGARTLREPSPTYGHDPADTLERMGILLASVPIEARAAFADLLHGWALEGGSENRRPYLMALLRSTPKQHA